MICGEGRFLRCGASVLRDKVSVTRDRSSVPEGGENERKDSVSQIKTRR